MARKRKRTTPSRQSCWSWHLAQACATLAKPSINSKNQIFHKSYLWTIKAQSLDCLSRIINNERFDKWIYFEIYCGAALDKGRYSFTPSCLCWKIFLPMEEIHLELRLRRHCQIDFFLFSLTGFNIHSKYSSICQREYYLKPLLDHLFVIFDLSISIIVDTLIELHNRTV